MCSNAVIFANPPLFIYICVFTVSRVMRYSWSYFVFLLQKFNVKSKLKKKEDYHILCKKKNWSEAKSQWHAADPLQEFAPCAVHLLAKKAAMHDAYVMRSYRRGQVPWKVVPFVHTCTLRHQTRKTKGRQGEKENTSSFIASVSQLSRRTPKTPCDLFLRRPDQMYLGARCDRLIPVWGV